jgi:hypothetical protein
MCGFDTSMGDNPEVASPHVSSGRAKAITQSADQTYRGMEAAGDANAQAAADHLGVPVSEMSDLKIINLNDSLREGDAAAKMPANDVSRMVAAAPTVLGNQSSEVGRFFADSTPKTGIGARSGTKSRVALQNFHTQFGAAAVAGSEKGRY